MTNNYNYQISNYENDECITRGICSVNSTVSSFQEIIVLYLKELSFYLFKLQKFGITNNQIKETVLFAIFNIITNVEYNQEQFSKLIQSLYNAISQSKILYEKTCAEKDIQIEKPKTYFKYSKSFNLSDAIRKGEKYFLKKSVTLSQKQKDFYDLVIFLIKGMCIKIVELQRMGQDYEEGYYEILSLFTEISSNDLDEFRITSKINESIEIYYNLIRHVYNAQVNLYGVPQKTEVQFSTQQGHAILVSGSDFKKLENVLKAVEGKDINVYTHGFEMLMAHSFPKIKAHPNLKGHYGTSIDSSLIDFSSFPGAILMTKASLQRVEYLYRGRLFTLDYIAPPGTVQIKDNNYEHLIKSALEAKGFVASQKKAPLSVGVDEDEFSSKMKAIIDKIVNKKIKKLYIVGLLNTLNIAQKDYFETFLSLVPKDSFVISLSVPSTAENVLHFNSFCDYSLFYRIIQKLRDNIDIKNTDISIFITRCDKHTIDNLIFLKKIGIKNILLCKCFPTLINPGLLATLEDTFDIKPMTTIEKDWEIIK